MVNVFKVQERLRKGGRQAYVDTIRDILRAAYRKGTPEQIMREVENNCQSILGYVVRWVDQGGGCSKVPDMNDFGLMEVRATCQISAQHVANWLHHGIVSRDDVMDALRMMATIVDREYGGDPNYRPNGAGFSGHCIPGGLRSSPSRTATAVRLHGTGASPTAGRDEGGGMLVPDGSGIA